MDPDRERLRVGLCFDCRHARRIHSDRGSTFYLCGRSVSDPRFEKYPALPVLACPGFESSKGQGKRQGEPRP